MNAVLSNLITVIGMLSAGLVTNVVQNRRERDARQDARSESLRAELLAAVTTLVSALADHRRAMWSLENARLSGADPETVAAAVTTHHATQAAVTTPLTTVSILAPTLAEPAEKATQATFSMRNAANAGDPDVLEARRQAARDASDGLVASAPQVLRAHHGDPKVGRCAMNAGTVYLLHFERPYRHARHYLGWASDLNARLADHAAGRGARLLAVVRAAGISWTLARTWPGDRHRERQLKRQGGASRRCPMCGVQPRQPRSGGHGG